MLYMKRNRKNIHTEFAALIEKHQELLERICISFSGGDDSIYQDLKQEVALSLWKEYGTYGLSRLRNKQKEESWMYSVAFYTALHYKRSHLRTTSLISYSPDMLIYDQTYLTDEPLSLFDELIECLSMQERRLVLYFLNGEDYKSIAQKEGISMVAARKRMSRVIAKLRQYNENDHGDSS